MIISVLLSAPPPPRLLLTIELPSSFSSTYPLIFMLSFSWPSLPARLPLSQPAPPSPTLWRLNSPLSRANCLSASALLRLFHVSAFPASPRQLSCPHSSSSLPIHACMPSSPTSHMFSSFSSLLFSGLFLQFHSFKHSFTRFPRRAAKESWCTYVIRIQHLHFFWWWWW